MVLLEHYEVSNYLAAFFAGAFLAAGAFAGFSTLAVGAFSAFAGVAFFATGTFLATNVG